MDRERVEFLIGGAVLGAYDLSTESDRSAFVDEHLALAPATPGRAMGMAVRRVVVEQVLDDDPPETWLTVQRLRAAGLDRDAIVGQIAMVIADHLQSALEVGSSFDLPAYVAALDTLPLPTTDEVARALIDVARAEPGIDADTHVARAVEALAPAPGSIIESLVGNLLDDMVSGPLHWLPDDATVHVPDLVDGRTFTHRVTDAELEIQTISAGFDLGAFARFDTLRLRDGVALAQFSVERSHLAWRGPDGWLSTFSPGDLIAVSVVVHAPDGGAVEPVEGTITMERLAADPEASDAVVRAVRAGYDELVAEPGLPVSGEELGLWLCARAGEVFAAPQLPLADLCAHAGLEQRGSEVAHEARIWRRDLANRRMAAVMSIASDHDARLALARAVSVLDDPEVSVDDVRSALDTCAEPERIDILADVLFPHGVEPADVFDRSDVNAPAFWFDLVDRAVAVAKRPREVATAGYLACVLSERCGEPARAEAHLARAAQAAPRLGPIVERMGWYRFDRGDARGAMKWWRQLRALPAAAAVMEPFLDPSDGRKPGRNEPCWCGSGRKFKQCHQGATELPPLPDRVGWLCRKTALWIEHADGEVRAVVNQAATARLTGDPEAQLHEVFDPDDPRSQDAFIDAFDDPIVYDAALHEGRLFERFLRERGELLPDDEQLLASAWLTVDRSVHEIVAVDPGRTLTLRDLATGDEIEVRERTASREVRVGERWCARVVPDGAGHQIIGGVFPVATGREGDVLELCQGGDEVELCAWVGALHQPPTIVHKPGMLEAMLDRSAVDAALASLGPDADMASISAVLGSEINRQMQKAWLDEPVPALGGVTPREAAADPTRRGQLERLLDEFDRRDRRFHAVDIDESDGFQPVTWDVAQLRRELGLTER